MCVCVPVCLGEYNGLTLVCSIIISYTVGVADWALECLMDHGALCHGHGVCFFQKTVKNIKINELWKVCNCKKKMKPIL